MKKRPLSALDKQVEKALQIAVRKVIEESKKLGMSISVWKDGKVVTIPAKKINLKHLVL